MSTTTKATTAKSVNAQVDVSGNGRYIVASVRTRGSTSGWSLYWPTKSCGTRERLLDRAILPCIGGHTSGSMPRMGCMLCPYSASCAVCRGVCPCRLLLILKMVVRIPRKVSSCARVNPPLPDCLLVTALGPLRHVGLFVHNDTRLENSISAGLFFEVLSERFGDKGRLSYSGSRSVTAEE